MPAFSGPDPLAPPRRSARPLRVSLAVLSLTLSSLAGVLAGEQSSQDLELAVKARQCLADAGSDASSSVGVSVRDGVVSLWGTVASPRASRQLAELVKQVPGVQGVRNELRMVVPDDEPGKNKPAGVHRTRPLDPPASLAARTDEAKRPEAQGLVWRPAAKPPNPPAERDSRTPMTAANPFAPTPLLDAVEALCRRDIRLAGVRAEVRGSVVYLRGQVYRWEDLFELARAVGQLPGVECVVLQDIRTN
jgi:osmotically-inducible protein OsmY